MLSEFLDVAKYFERRLGDDEAEQANTWENICHPWLSDYWPKAQERNTSKTSVALVQCLIKTGDAFPAALQWGKEFLRPGTDHVLWRIRDIGVHQRWPNEALDLLSIMIPGNNLPGWERHTLRGILDQMVEADQNIAQDQRFQRLYRM